MLLPGCLQAAGHSGAGEHSGTGAQQIVSANIGCTLRLQSGTAQSLRRWVEVLDDALSAQRSAPSRFGSTVAGESLHRK